MGCQSSKHVAGGPPIVEGERVETTLQTYGTLPYVEVQAQTSLPPPLEGVVELIAPTSDSPRIANHPRAASYLLPLTEDSSYSVIDSRDPPICLRLQAKSMRSITASLRTAS
jgi:hypothetical protein